MMGLVLQRTIQRRRTLGARKPKRPAPRGHKRKGEDAERCPSTAPIEPSLRPSSLSSLTFSAPPPTPSHPIHILYARALTLLPSPQITVSIGDEIRSSSSLADTMNDSFDNTRVRLRGTMNRMLRMAEKTGVGWKVWVAFFVAVWLVFAYVWLF